jgi:hypothetical protein
MRPYIDNKMKQHFIAVDDDTYEYGGQTYLVEVKDGKHVEPYILDIDNIHVEFFRSKSVFVIYKDHALFEIAWTMTCWSDDRVVYRIKNDKLVSRNERYHGWRSLDIEYDENECISSFKYGDRTFGTPPRIGQRQNALDMLNRIYTGGTE